MYEIETFCANHKIWVTTVWDVFRKIKVFFNKITYQLSRDIHKKTIFRNLKMTIKPH